MNKIITTLRKEISSAAWFAYPKRVENRRKEIKSGRAGRENSGGGVKKVGSEHKDRVRGQKGQGTRSRRGRTGSESKRIRKRKKIIIEKLKFVFGK